MRVELTVAVALILAALAASIARPDGGSTDGTFLAGLVVAPTGTPSVVPTATPRGEGQQATPLATYEQRTGGETWVGEPESRVFVSASREESGIPLTSAETADRPPAHSVGQATPEPAPVEPTPTIRVNDPPMPVVAIAPDGCPEIIGLVFGEARDDACKIAHCESTYNPLALGRAGERSLFQLHPVHDWRFIATYGSEGDAWNVEQHVMVAKQLYDEQGWRPWTCRRVLG